MASDNDKKIHRKSFFSFGSVSLDKGNSRVDMTSAKTHTPKNERSKKPLEMQPLRNRNPFIEEVDHHGDKEVPRADSSSNALTGSDIKPLRRMSTNPFLIDEKMTNMPKTAPRMRRPPPPVDMDAVKVFAHTAPLDITTSSSTAQVSSTDETLKSASLSPIRTPVPPVENLLNQHRRQRSEAEKLVDDLDDYIKQHEKRITSHSPEEVDHEGDHEEDVSANMDSEVSLESPFLSVDPLSMVASDRESRLEHRAARKSDLGSEFETDAFSFTDSLNGKSVNSIQQVAMSEVNGAAPILVKLGYTNSNATQSDSNENYESANQQAHHNRPRIENIREITSHGESPKAEQDQFNDNDNDSYSSQVESEEPRRTFRVVNEDRPHFYFQTAGDTTTSTNASSTTEDDAPESNCESTNQNENEDRLSVYSSSNHKYPQDSSGEDRHSGRERSSINKFMGRNSPTSSEDFNRVGSLLEGGALKIEEAGDAAPLLDTPTVLRNPSIRSSDSTTTTTSGSSRPDKTVRLVSSYVEELRLKYYKTSNFLAAPPNLPVTLKQKNNLIQPKNIKVRIRTSSKQIGIKHGGAKQKLLSLETANEDSREGINGAKFQSSKNRIDVDHTKEFHDLLNNGGMGKRSNSTNDRKTSHGSNDDPEKYMNEIPGDDAYDSDDAMAPLREKGGARSLRGPTRSNTVVSYYTKNQNRFRSGTLDNGYAYLQDLPANINIKDYEDNVSVANSAIEESIISDDSSSLEQTFSYNRGPGLHLANPDTNSD